VSVCLSVLCVVKVGHALWVWTCLFFFLSSWYCCLFELRASHLLGRRATLEPTTSIISVSTWFVDHSTHLFEGSALVWFSV
jgi:hypothetical protein